MGEGAGRDLLIVSDVSRFHPIGPSRPGSGGVIAGSAGGVVMAVPEVPVDPSWLTDTLSALAGTHQVPGAQLAVHRAGVTVAVEVGELEHGAGTPITSETAFPAGSITKACTATLAMILIADGDLDLDAPLSEYLPELDLGRHVTLGQLLSHTSGLATSPDTPELSALSLGRYVRAHCRRQDLILAPGTGFSYSSRNYSLVGHLIETITGMSWWEAVESILLRPLGIEPAAVGGAVPAGRRRSIASGHSVNTALGRTRSVHQSLIPAEAPAGALAMSARDLVALGLMHVGTGFSDLLPAGYAEQMRQPVPCAEPFGLADGWSAGWAVFRHGSAEWVGHDGNAHGTSCYLRIDPAGGSVVALTTNSNTGAHVWEGLRTGLAEMNLPRGTQHPDITRHAPVAPPVQCAGRYLNGPTEYVVTVSDDGSLYLATGNEVIARLVCYDDLVFALQDLTSGQELHLGRFLRDPTTQHIEQLQIGGRLARRDQASHARLRAASLNRRSA